VYEITIDFPNMPKGQQVSIPGLGTYENGSTNVVSKEEAEAFKAYQTDTGMPDQTLLQAFKGQDFVKVVTSKTEEHPKRQRDPAAPPEEVRTPPATPPHVNSEKDGDK
jgi:hypothetical protein